MLAAHLTGILENREHAHRRQKSEVSGKQKKLAGEIFCQIPDFDGFTADQRKVRETF